MENKTNMKKYIEKIKKHFPNSSIVYRSDGRVEWVCEHGVGHTISVPRRYENQESWWAHGCDGCCKLLDAIK